MEPIFTYRVPHQLHGALRVGQLVWVPLRNQFIQGIVLNLYTASEAPPSFRPDPGAPYDLETYTIRNIDSIVDPDVALTLAQIRLARWLSEYYRFSLYEALALMLPPGVSQEMETVWRASADGMTIDLGVLPERERSVLYFLRQQGETTERELRKNLRGSDSELRSLYNSLQERGFAVRGVAVKRPKTRPRIERFVRLQIPYDQLSSTMLTLERAPKQQAVIAFLQSKMQPDSNALPIAVVANADTETLIPLSTIYVATGATIQTIRALERKGVLNVLSREVRRDPLAGDQVPPDIPPPLTRAQERIWQQIAASLEQSNQVRASDTLPHGDVAAQFLLHGVTGSGKTELYLRAIGWVLRRGQQALVLVPEIALTAQLVRRFAARFPGQLAVLHSNLSLGERYDEWRQLRHGEAMIAIGSRSATFAPLPKLGLIIVDEEHESSYKHDSSPRYHARDVAQKLAAYTGSVLILGSATPSVESYYATEIGKLALLSLTERVGMAYDTQGLPTSKALPLPPIRIVDMRHELQDGNRSIFSRALQDALQNVLERQEQAILFLNRRGAAAFVMCRDCGHVVTCPNCSAPLTPHYTEFPEEAPVDGDGAHTYTNTPHSVLICHGCNYHEAMPIYCPQCLSPRIRSFGIGTQRVVEEVERLFPGVRALRWDRDTVSHKGDHTRMLDHFLNYEADVLVGTQMIAKGLDLPLVSVVGVVAADTGLYLPDFRTGERTFQLLTQVAGRAGRRGANAQVVIQTYVPDHYALRTAQEHDYEAFYTQEIAFRKQTRYPPYSRLIRFIYTSGNDDQSQRAAMEFVGTLEACATALNLDHWGIVGPAPAFFHKQRNRYRWHILLRATDPTPLLETLQLPPGWVIDVDPVHVL